MDRNSELYRVGLALHGHKCPAMPLGLRAGLAAMEALGVQHAPDGQLSALVEIDRNHCSTCFADGVQVATGCTFGKGNIRSLGYGKFALTLILRFKVEVQLSRVCIIYLLRCPVAMALSGS
jgi:formylmethanofuran dehydrogenase subunit E